MNKGLLSRSQNEEQGTEMRAQNENKILFPVVYRFKSFINGNIARNNSDLDCFS